MIDQFFSAEEVARLEHGLPNLNEWSNNLLVSFELRQLRHARVIWLNSRWFLERQFDIEDAPMRQRVTDWLVAEFGYAVPRDGDTKNAYTDTTRALYADRYGTTSGESPHGGSGRAGIAGCFQAKGIGTSPLVGHGAAPGHAHGCLSLEESIREASYGEVCAAEFPHGAVPVIAILDTGLRFSSPDVTEKFDQNVRRGIIIRPSVLRAAHAERAPLFKRSASGYVNSQVDDVQRTRDVVQRWSKLSRLAESKIPPLPQFTEQLARQVAFGQVHRLFNGGFFSSNVSVDGALLDFGNMHALPNWISARVLDNVPGFGSDWLVVHKIIRSLVFYFKKYDVASAVSVSEAELAKVYEASYSETFERECLRMWNLYDARDSRAARTVYHILRSYFNAQQKRRAVYRFGKINDTRIAGDLNVWLYDAMLSPQKSTRELQVLTEIHQVLSQHFGDSLEGRRQQNAAKLTSARYLMPRGALDRANLMNQTRRLISINEGMALNQATVALFIRQHVGHSRRHWPRLPTNLAVNAYVNQDYSNALLCTRIPDGERVVWLEGIVLGKEYRGFDKTFPSDDVAQFGVHVQGGHWSAAVPLPLGTPAESLRNGDIVLSFGSTKARIPPMTIWFGIS